MKTAFQNIFARLLLISLLMVSGSYTFASQTEPSIDLGTVPGAAGAHHVITEPGLYYLSGDLEVTKATGINIRAAGVTLDLNGFEIRRVSGTGGHGILIAIMANGCAIRNGSVTGFGYGVRAFAERGAYLKVKASHCAFAGLVGGDLWLIVDCEADNNPEIDIATGDGSRLVHRRSSDQSRLRRHPPASAASVQAARE